MVAMTPFEAPSMTDMEFDALFATNTLPVALLTPMPSGPDPTPTMVITPLDEPFMTETLPADMSVT